MGGDEGPSMQNTLKCCCLHIMLCHCVERVPCHKGTGLIRALIKIRFSTLVLCLVRYPFSSSSANLLGKLSLFSFSGPTETTRATGQSFVNITPVYVTPFPLPPAAEILMFPRLTCLPCLASAGSHVFWQSQADSLSLNTSDISSLFQSSGFSCEGNPSHSQCIAQLSLFPPQYY